MSRVYRCFTEKKPGFDVEAQGVLRDLRGNLGVRSIDSLRLFSRYDVEGVSGEVYSQARGIVFSEPQVDECYDEALPVFSGDHRILAVEALPGQYDQRADSCAQCIQMLTCMDRPVVRSAKVYVFFGALTDADMAKLRAYLINPVESCEAKLDKPDTLEMEYPVPQPVPVINGFIGADRERLTAMLSEYGLAMDLADLEFMKAYFRDEEKRDPTVTELRLIDTYWSDHCRHTTFGTHIDCVEISDSRVAAAYAKYLSARSEVYGSKAETRPQTLMDVATIGTKALRSRGLLKNIDVSEEINACSIHIDVNTENGPEDWLLMFKNETHNHPTEIEPFGGAATCIGGAIRDPLSGRAYVYQAMRVTGAGDPRVPIAETLPGKLPQRKLTVTAAQGYSSYGNQIGLATGLVHEVYHPGYVAKRLEIGAVVGAVKAENVVRMTPAPGDAVILLGGRTGRDGIGGATGSSKSHDTGSIVTMASEVQKGNAPEERKIQRLFLDPEVTKMIKRCNDFGAGGVSVAIGELADGLDINLSLVRKKYEGLDGTELAISESQERMAVVVAPEDVDRFIKKAEAENLEAYAVATVTESPRMVMKLDGRVIADLSREFLSSNGADKHTKVKVPAVSASAEKDHAVPFAERMRELVTKLSVCSQRGLSERFDSTIGAASVLAPFGGATMLTPAQSMAALIPVRGGETDTCSVMSFGFDPEISAGDPFGGSRGAVITSAAKLVAAGCDPDGIYLTLQEYFEKLRDDPVRWGKPFSALLGALDAQLGLGMAAIGGKDSMSGSFGDMDVPPTLVSFAIAPNSARYVVSPEFKQPGDPVYIFPADGLPLEDLKERWRAFRALCVSGAVRSAWALTSGGTAEAVFKMGIGNGIGFTSQSGFDIFACHEPGTIIAELDPGVPAPCGAELIGCTNGTGDISCGGAHITVDALRALWESPLEKVFPTRAGDTDPVEKITWTGERAVPSVTVAHSSFARPRAVITAFPGTNCELDTARAVERAGGEPQIIVIRNLTPSALEQSVAEVEKAVKNSQMVILPGGFSGGDEPDGSAKFIAAFFRNSRITDAVHELLRNRDGLMLGICNGFQALIKLGLVPFGSIVTTDASCPTLTYNLIGRHQSRYVYTRISSAASPWLSLCKPGDVHAVPVSHGEGRFVADEATVKRLIENGQIATQYCDASGSPSMDISVNPNGSVMAVEGIMSPDGRVLGKMGHTERRGPFVGKNITGEKHQPIFEGGVAYFR